MIGRMVLSQVQASANYVMREVRRRRTGEVSWEVVSAETGQTVASGLADREEALRFIRGWEALSRKLEGGLPGHRLVH